MQEELVGKVGSVFVSTGTGGSNESTIISFVTTLMHHGMIVVVSGIVEQLPVLMARELQPRKNSRRRTFKADTWLMSLVA